MATWCFAQLFGATSACNEIFQVGNTALKIVDIILLNSTYQRTMSSDTFDCAFQSFDEFRKCFCLFNMRQHFITIQTDDWPIRPKYKVALRQLSLDDALPLYLPELDVEIMRAPVRCSDKTVSFFPRARIPVSSKAIAPRSVFPLGNSKNTSLSNVFPII